MKRVTTHTKKRKVQITIPELRNYVVQPNQVTNARYEYTLIQERVFTAIMYKLQDVIKKKINYNPIQNMQTDLFANHSSEDVENTIKITLPLKDLADKSKYNTVIESAKKMGNISIEFPSFKENIDRTYYLLRAVDTPAIGNRHQNLDVYINRDVAEILINVITNRLGQPVEYTRFMYEIAQQASSKYSSLMYKKICSWKKRGGFTILLEELYKDLCVNNAYLLPDGRINYKNFKSKVLEKSKEELFQKADCWFEYTENYKGRSVHSINFKIITPQLVEKINEHKDYIKYLLKNHFNISSDDISKHLSPLFTEENFDHVRLSQKILEIHEAMHKIRYENKNKVFDPKAYAMKSLINFVNEIKNNKKQR